MQSNPTRKVDPTLRSRRIASALPLAISALLMLGSRAEAADWGLETSAGMLTTDNLLRTPSDGADSSVQEASAVLTLREATRTLDVDLVGGLVYRQYDVDDVDNDLLPTLNLYSQWTIAPEQFAWVLTDNFGQRAINPNDGLIPTDREDVNIIGTGPEFRLPLGGSSWLTAAARFSNVAYENSPLDNDRLAGRVGYTRELDTGRTWGVNYSNAKTEFKDLPREFTIQRVYGSYVATGQRGGIDANLGVTMLDDANGNDTGFFGDIRFERQITRHSTISLDLVHRIADTADVFRRQQDLEPDIETVIDVTASDQALKETSADLGYTWVGRRTRLGLGARYLKEKFYDDFVSANRSGSGYYGLVEFRLTNSIMFQSRAEWREDAPELEDSSQFVQARVGVLWQFTRSLAFDINAERYTRDGNPPTDYEETRYGISLQWVVRELQAPELRPRIDTPASRRMNVPRQAL